MIRLWTAAAIVAALLLVLLGRVIPVPPVVTGEEGSRTDLVKIRTDVVMAINQHGPQCFIRLRYRNKMRGPSSAKRKQGYCFS